MQADAKVGAAQEQGVVSCREPGCFDGDTSQLVIAFKFGDSV